ncbi:YCF48-related protein [Methylomonas montana]|uniref:YCF48-related protein n=1 Tax=Methylomonas montana TaxID=3058963 RepID=UPI002659B51F|nr:YCF48-related protein [Methylomonas montana]WKJ88992.1 YCF48-related protein [Methylomonas montana]
MQAPDQTKPHLPLWLLPVFNFLLALAATLSFTLFAFIQDPHPDAFRAEPTWTSLDFWKYPIERNAFRRLPVIGAKLNDIAVSADGSRMWAVGGSGLFGDVTIVYSHDSGKHWQPATIAWQANGNTEANSSSAFAAQSANSPAQAKVATANEVEPIVLRRLNRISFIDDNRGWAVGVGGTILNSADGGQTWRMQSSGTRASLNAVQFLGDGQRGWAVGDNGTILSSADGGQTWQMQSSGTQTWLSAVQFLGDGRRGWAVGSSGSILSSADGGQTWQAQSSGTQVELTAVQFLGNGQRGWVVGSSGSILSSADGGQTWQAKNSGTQALLSAVQFLGDGRRGWAVGSSGSILSSADGGQTWQAQSSGTQVELTAVQFLGNGQHGWVVGYNGTILSSADSGQTWLAQSSGIQTWLRAVQFLGDGQRGWAVGYNGSILSSADSGQTWQAQSSGTQSWLSAVQFLGDGQRGWTVGQDGTILSSVDGGQTWQAQNSGTQAPLSTVQFLGDGQRGWAVGSNGTILSTVDGGKTWQTQSSGTQSWLSAVQFLGDGQRGWAVGSRGSILSSADGGKTWQAQSSGTQAELRAVQFLSDGQRGWAVGSNGTILSTAVGGKTWQAQSGDKQAELSAVQILGDGLRGWAVGDNGTILSSADGGQIWQTQSSGKQSWLSAVQFLGDGQRGWVVGEDGTILSSADGGQVWQDIHYRKTPAPWFYALVWYLWAWLVLSGKRMFKALMGKAGSDQTVEKFGLNAIGTTDNPGGPASADYLGSLQLARDIADFLRNEHTMPPLTLAITGDWGSGKSTVMTYLQAQLRRAGMRPVLYNAWHHQEEQQVLGSILECVRQQATPRWWPWLLPALWFRARSLIHRRWWLKLLILMLAAALVFLASHAERQQTVVAWWHDLAEQLNLEKPALLSGRGYAKLCPAEAGSLDKSNPTVGKTVTELSAEECRKLVCLVQPQLKSEVQRPEDCAKAVHFNNDAEFLDEVERAFGMLTDERRQLITAQLEHAGDSNSSLPFWLITGLGGLMPLILLIIRASSMFGLASTDLLKSAVKTVGLTGPAEPLGTRQIWQQRFQRLTHLLGGRTLVLFIDDLDRCQREHVMRVLEILNFLVNAGDLYIVLGVAPKYVLANVKLHFEDLAKALHEFDGNGAEQDSSQTKSKPRNLARFYLQKLINIEVPVPKASPESMRKLLFGEGGEIDSEAQREEKIQKIGVYLDLGLQIVLAVAVLLGAAIYPWPNSQRVSESSVQSSSAGNSTNPAQRVAKPGTAVGTEQTAAQPDRVELVESGYFRPAPEAWPTSAQLTTWGLSLLALFGVLFAGLLGIWRDPQRWQQWHSAFQRFGKSFRREFVGAEPLKDSDVFKQALEIWMPLIAADRSGVIHAPRIIRAFLNRLRFLAARWPKDRPYSEAQLVSLAALHFHLGDDDFKNVLAIILLDHGTKTNCSYISKHVVPILECHLDRFGMADEEDQNLFEYLISGLEIHKP